MRFSIAVRALVVASCVASAAAAQTHDAVGAEALFREGRADADAGNYAAACPKFAASYRLDPTQGTLFNLADCEERNGKLASAWQHFHQLLDQLPPADDRRAYVQSHSTALEQRVPRLRVVLDAHGASVERDGAPLGDALLNVPVPMDPGAHHFIVRAPGHADRVFEVTLAENERRDFALAVGPAAKTPTVQVAARPVVTNTHTPFTRTLGFVIGGVGVATAAVGGVFGGLALADNGQSNASCAGSVCVDQHAVDLHERAKTEANVADAMIFGGAALAIVGLVLVLTSHATEVRMAPSVAGLSITGTFR